MWSGPARQKLTDTELQEALRKCNDTDIARLGGIQDFGVVLVADGALSVWRQVSDNTGRYLGVAASKLVGIAPSALLGDEFTHRLRGLLERENSATQRANAGTIELNARRFATSVYAAGGDVVVELFEERLISDAPQTALETARMFMGVVPDHSDLLGFFDLACERLRQVTQYDRVKFYQFQPDGSGVVIAESRVAGAQSFIGLHFPASDIPPIARKLYASTPIRILRDTAAPNVAMVAADREAPCDLSLAILRGLDPVHRTYLANMGVRGSMTVPVVIDGALWGLFACHHHAPLSPDADTVTAAELIGRVVGLQVQSALERRRNDVAVRAQQIAIKAVGMDDSALALGQYWGEHCGRLVDIVPADGVVLEFGGTFFKTGAVPDDDTLARILSLMAARGEDVVSEARLADHLPDMPLTGSAGILVITLSASPRIRIAFLRDFYAHTVQWAGSPEKALEQTQDGPRLNPRASFDRYLEVMETSCKPWAPDELDAAFVIQDVFRDALRLRSEMTNNRQRLGLLVRELNHRVANILTLVQSLLMNTGAGAASIEEFTERLQDRIVSLAGAHRLLTDAPAGLVSVAEIFETELQPFLGGAIRANLSGPKVEIGPDTASVLALVIHELTTNASKYGALSVQGGLVSVSWALTPEGLRIDWQEDGGPPVRTPERRGFGRTVIEQVIPFELGGQGSIEFAEAGVRSSLMVPRDALQGSVAARGGQDRGAKDKPVSHKSTDRVLGRALVVEDNFLIAQQTVQHLSDLGFQDVTLVSREEDALEQLQLADFDLAVIDANLRGAIANTLMGALSAGSVPFVVVSGYGRDAWARPADIDAPLLRKPVSKADLRGAIHAVLEKEGLG